MVAFDAAAPAGDEALEDAVRIAASVGDYVCRSGGAVRLLVGAIDAETGSRSALLEELALLQPTGNRSWHELIECLPPVSKVVAIVGESDAEGVQALFRLAGRRSRMVVFVLRDPRLSQAGREAVQMLRGTGATVVECRQGDVAGALRLVEGWFPAGPSAR